MDTSGAEQGSESYPSEDIPVTTDNQEEQMNMHTETLYKVIRRNGTVTPFTINKISIALTKAFLDVEGESASGSSRIHDTIEQLTAQVKASLFRRMPDGGIVHIENIQDQVELALMRSGERKVARSYVLYREQRAKIREQKTSKEATPKKKNILHVKTASGELIPLNEERLQQLIKESVKGLDGVDEKRVLQEAMHNLFDGIPETDISTALVMSTRVMIERDPNYSNVAARLLLDGLRSEAISFLHGRPSEATQAEMEALYPELLPKYIKRAIELELLDEELGRYDLKKLGAAIKVEQDHQFTYLGLQTLYDRYFIHTEDGIRFELPQIFFMRVAMGLAINEIDRETRAIEFYDLLSSFNFMSSTPTLFNSGSLRPQLSSCYLTTVPDDLAGIYDAIKDNALLSKFAGGLGNDWTPVRGLGSHIKGTNGKSQGVVPFLKVSNDTAVAVNQGGRRRGAFCAYLETWHIDIEEFLELRKNTGDERRRTHDMNTAHWIPDLFMERVAKEENWTLFSPDETPELHELYGKAFEAKYIEYEEKAARGEMRLAKTIKAKNLWRKMLGMLFETGHPWLCFSGDTKVAVADGREPVDIKELAKSTKKFPVYSARAVSESALNFKNKNQRHWIEEIKMATAFKSGKRNLVKVYLDDGSSFRCTEDHLLALKDGGYVRADEAVGLSLCPFNRWQDPIRPNNRYIGRNKDPRQRQANMIWNFHNGDIPKGYVVDHIKNGHGDVINNLQLLTIEEHNKKTSLERTGENNPFYGKTHSKEARKKISENTKNFMTTEYKQHLSDVLKGKKKPDRYGLSNPELIIKGREFYNKYNTLSNKSWRKYYKDEGLPSAGYIENRFTYWSSFTDSCINNHKVIKVEQTGKTEDVYDLSVEDNHNFFIVTNETDAFKSGVLVHNCFKDPCNIRYSNQHVGVVHSSNLCTEITLHTDAEQIAVCNLGSVNLAAHTTKDGLDMSMLEKTITTATRMLDNVIEYNYYSVPQARRSNLQHRPVGLGIMGFQDALYKLNIAYASEEAVEFADRSMEAVSYFAIQGSNNLAKERGSYSTYQGSLWSRGILPIDSIELMEKERGEYYQMDKSSTLDWDSLRESIQQHGMRNSNVMAIAPTATISNICGVSQSIEPTYQNIFVKSNLSGEFTVVNPYMVNELKQLGLWDEVMINDMKYFDGSVQPIERIPEAIKTKYATAFEIDPRWLIEAASRRQKWIDQGQSLNLYMSEPSGDKLDNLYKLAWVRGLKTTYYLRSMGATHMEKTSDDRIDADTNADTSISSSAKAPAACSILDPECEACQ